MAQFLLDTDATIELLRGRNERIASYASAYAAEIAVSAVTVAELEYGLLRSASESSDRQVLREFIALVATLPIDAAVAAEAGKIRFELSGAGTPIGPLDTFVAATARHHGLTVVTGNTREYSRVAELNTTNWLR